MPEIKTTDQKMNPQIEKLEIGVRSLRTIKIYPFAVADETRATELVAASINTISELPEDSSFSAMAVSFIDLVKKHAEEIILMSTYEEEVTLSDFSNLQFAEFARILYDQNFGQIAKNYPDLWNKIKEILQEKVPLLGEQRSSHQSSESTPDTDSNTSPDSPSEKGA